MFDGVYRRRDGEPAFVEVPTPTAEAVQALLHKIIGRLMKLLSRRGVLIEEQGSTYLADNDTGSGAARTLRPLQAAACTYRIAFGPRAGQKVLTVQGARPRDVAFTQALCADEQGFSLHAAVRCGADERRRLEQLCRFITRRCPSVDSARSAENDTAGFMSGRPAPPSSERLRVECAERELLDAAGRCRGPVDQRKQFRPGVTGVVESDQHAAVENEGRHAGWPDASPARQRDQVVQCPRVVVDRSIDDAQAGPLHGQAGRELPRVGAVRAPFAHEHLEHALPFGRRRGRCRRGRHCHRHERQQQDQRYPVQATKRPAHRIAAIRRANASTRCQSVNSTTVEVSVGPCVISMIRRITMRSTSP